MIRAYLTDYTHRPAEQQTDDGYMPSADAPQAGQPEFALPVSDEVQRHMARRARGQG